MTINMVAEITKLRESHIGYILLSDEELKQEIEVRVSSNTPTDLLLFGPDEWKRYLGIELTKEQLGRVPKFPWDKKLLDSSCPLNPGKTIKETHFAFLGLDQINGKKTNLRQLKNKLLPGVKVSFRNDCYDYNIDPGSPGFVRKPLEFKWYLMPIIQLSANESRTITAAKKSISPEYRVASAVEEVFKAVLLFSKTSQMSISAIVADKTQNGNLTVAMSSGKTVTVGQIGYKFKEEMDTYGNNSRERIEKNTNMLVALCRN